MIEDLFPAMNNDQWNELRRAMHTLHHALAWRSRFRDGEYTEPDWNWFNRFREGQYEDILYVDILVENDSDREEIRATLKAIRVPAEETDEGFRVFGYGEKGKSLSYL